MIMMSRRSLLLTAAALSLPRGRPSLAAADPRVLALYNPNTGESFEGKYHDGTALLDDAERSLTWLMRDHRQGIARGIDPAVFDLLWQLQERYRRARGHRPIININSGFRTKATNDALRVEGAALNSYHLRGQAVDVSVQGYGIRILANMATAVQTGGLGIYWRRNFVHLDTGPRRFWYQR